MSVAFVDDKIRGEAVSAAKALWDIVYICDWLPPDFGAVGQYSELFSREMASKGRRVVLIGLGTIAKDQMTEEVIGAGIVRKLVIASARYDKSSTSSRMAWTARTNFRLMFAAWRYIRRSKEVIFTGSPPLFLHWIAPANLFLRKTLIYRITDFHPECAIAERTGPSWFLGLLYRLTLFWRRRVHQFEVLGYDQMERLRSIGISDDRIRLKRDPSPVPIGPQTKPLERPKAADGKVLLLYSGTWGVAHDYKTFVRAYSVHHRTSGGRVILWLNATGVGARKAEQALTRLNLPFIRGAPVALNKLDRLLVTPDAHLITLSDPFVGFVLPSKVYGCIASGKPILFFGTDRSDVHSLSVEARVPGYRRVSIGDVETGVRALNDLGNRLGP